jgi:hypothetical protein
LVRCIEWCDCLPLQWMKLQDFGEVCKSSASYGELREVPGRAAKLFFRAVASPRHYTNLVATNNVNRARAHRQNSTSDQTAIMATTVDKVSD